tara:strand:+ start:122 stop:508 length:387 start_codon:yes stop_codon:yes gene_type:complete
MKISKNQLKQIIKEELTKVLSEQETDITPPVIDVEPVEPVKVEPVKVEPVEVQLKPLRGSNLGYIGGQIEKSGGSIDDYDFVYGSTGYSAHPKGTYQGRGRVLDRPSAQELNWRPFGPSSYFTDPPTP